MSQHIDQLFEKYLNGTCSLTEWQELLALISRIEENDAETLSGPMHMLWEKARNKELPSTALLLERDKIYKAVTQEEEATVPLAKASEPLVRVSNPDLGSAGAGFQPMPSAHRIHFLKTSWFRYAAAIAVVAGATVVGVLNSRHPQVATTNGNKHLQTDVAPGGDKAVLTLANGQQIILDNAQNGNLAQQGNTKIIKLTSGQLTYNSGGPLPLVKGVRGDLLYNTISTPRGGQYQVTLPDGTSVWLNAASSIKFPTTFTGTERNVELSGEAYMEIAKNPKQSFSIKVNDAEVQVLGTSLNINAYHDEDQMKATLIEGSVKVKTGSAEVLLKPSEQAVVTNHDNQSISKLTVQTDEVTAWKNGFFQFDRASIPAVMRQLSRWYDVDIQYVGTVPDRQFKGKLQRSLPLSGVIDLLEKGDVHLKLEGRTLTVLP